MNNITVSEVQEGEFQGQWAVYDGKYIYDRFPTEAEANSNAHRLRTERINEIALD